jgi:hypothetical protein
MLKWVSKSGTFIQFSIFTVILVIAWIPAFVNPVPPVQTPSDGPLYSILVGWLIPFTTLNVAVALMLIVIQALILFYVYQANSFFKRSNFIPAIIILLAYSWNSNYQTMHALLPAGILIIMALNSIMRMYGRQEAYHQVFTASFSIGIASLFYISLAYLLLMIWLTLITYRISTWREYAVSIAGFSLPLIYYLSWLFWNDNLPSGLHQLSETLFNLILPPRLSVVNMIWLWISGFIMVVTMVAVLNIMNDKLINLRRRSWVLFNLSLTVVIMMIFAGWPMLSANYLFIAPMSFFITGSLTLFKRRFWFEVLALGYLILFVAMRVYMMVS